MQGVTKLILGKTIHISKKSFEYIIILICYKIIGDQECPFLCIISFFCKKIFMAVPMT